MKYYSIKNTKGEFLGRWDLTSPLVYGPISHAYTYDDKDRAVEIAKAYNGSVVSNVRFDLKAKKYVYENA